MYRNSRRLCVYVLFVSMLTTLILMWINISVYYDWKQSYLRKLLNNTKLVLDHFEVKGTKLQYSKNRAFIIDTPGCKIPKFDPYDRTLLHILATQPPHTCPGKPLFLINHPNGSISVNETILHDSYSLTLQNVSCTYKFIRRKHEDPGNTRENDYILGDRTKLVFGKPLNEDHITVQCKLGNDSLEQLIPIPRLIQKVEDKRSAMKPFIPQLNVILVAIDSISKLNFLRHFRETRQFMEKNLNFFDMKGYMKVGDNTFPNLICLLSGRFPQEVWNETVKDTMFFDDMDLVWKWYAARGYRTLFAEDMPKFGTFNYGKRGFNDQPTDYYFRPLSLAIRYSELYKNSKDFCLNSQTESDIIFNYLKDFTRNMGPRPYFAFAMISSLTHDLLNKAAYADRPTVRLLDYLWNSGALNNSALVFFSDHGLRFGDIRKTYIGKFEERMPFMYLHFPSWFLRQYPQYSANLLKNQERLITLFDVHSTLLHLLDPSQQLSEKLKNSVTPYGTSLINEVSPYRTCEKASIMAPWCVCLIFHEESPNATVVIRSAVAIVNFINKQLVSYDKSCAHLEVGTITNAQYGQISDLISRFVKHENVVINRYVVFDTRIDTYVDYIVTLTTEPGNLSFEGTVRLDISRDIYKVLFVRSLTDYVSYCINGVELEVFCNCI